MMMFLQYFTLYLRIFTHSLSFRERVRYMIPTDQQVTLTADIPKREAVKAAFLHAWDYYGWSYLQLCLIRAHFRHDGACRAACIRG